MPTRRRVLLVLAAVAVLVGALALAGCGGSGSGSNGGSSSGSNDARASVVARCLHDAVVTGAVDNGEYICGDETAGPGGPTVSCTDNGSGGVAEDFTCEVSGSSLPAGVAGSYDVTWDGSSITFNPTG